MTRVISVPGAVTRTRGKPAKPVDRSVAAPPDDETLRPQTFWERFWNALNGDEGAGYALSFVVHVVLLSILSIPILRTVKDGATYTTIVQKQTEDQVVFDSPIDTRIDMPHRAGGSEETVQMALLNPESVSPNLIPELKTSTEAAVEGDDPGDGGTAEEGFGGMRIAEPKNAIRQGSFSVWPWPILGKKLRGGYFHGEPGDFPKVFQNYHIVIRVRAPEGKRSVSLSDFSGMVVGTDKYRQKIPEDAWYFDTKGNFVRARTGRQIPVIEGTAELLIEVPGANEPNIRDSITVRFRPLDEEQTIELKFLARD